MVKKIIAAMLTTILLGSSLTLRADDTTFSVSYAPDATVKGPSLINATMNIKLYANGSPQGAFTVRTDVLQQFKLNIPTDPFLVVVVKSVENEPEGTRCFGYSRPGSTQIIINCRTISDALNSLY